MADRTAPLLERVAAALATGEPLDLLPALPWGELVSPILMAAWGPEHDLAAGELRRLLLEHARDSGPTPDPFGLLLRGARILGRLDLNFATLDYPISLRDCLLPEGLSAVGARLRQLSLWGSSARCAFGDAVVDLDESQIALEIDLRHTTLRTSAPGAAALSLIDASCSGSLDCHGATLRSTAGPALQAQRASIGKTVVLTAGFTAIGADGAGAVNLRNAEVRGDLECSGAVLGNDNGPALIAVQTAVSGNLLLDDGFFARSSGAADDGALWLTRLHVGGNLSCEGATLRNNAGPALSAAGAVVGGTLSCTGGFTAAARASATALTPPAVDLDRARVGGDLSLRGATLRSDTGPGLKAVLAKIAGGNVDLGDVSVSVTSTDAALQLIGAEIGGFLSCTNATVRNLLGPALDATKVVVDLAVGLGSLTAATGASQCSVNFAGAHIRGDLLCPGAMIRSDAGMALYLGDTVIDGNLHLTDGLTATGGGEWTTLVLINARIGRTLFCDDVRVEHRGNDVHDEWFMDGLTYSGLPEPQSRRWWIDLLSDSTSSYAPQPYQHLAAAYRAAGHDRDAREVLIAQRRDQIARGDLGRVERLWGRTTGVLLGYGWKPWRALYGLAATFLVSVVLAVALGGHGALTHPLPPGSAPGPGTPAQPCTVVERIGVGLDLGTPILGSATKSRDRCPISSGPNSATATALTVSTWVLQALAWAWAALFVAGFTSAVRKT